VNGQERGFTLTELLVAIAILLLFFGVAYSALLPVLTYLSPAQAKINTQQNAVPLLYKLQREVRQSDYRAIYALVGSTATPIGSISSFTDVTTFAIASAKNGAAGSGCYPGGAFQTVPGFGTAFWQGFDVFMLQNAALKCVYEPMTPAEKYATYITASQAQAAITAAQAIASPPVFGNAVLDVKMNSDSVSPYIVDFQIKAVSTVNGRSNATTYTDDILTRN
jgi:prepilin-type N-terminal cleavage/methylation domain-containing protein